MKRPLSRLRFERLEKRDLFAADVGYEIGLEHSYSPTSDAVAAEVFQESQTSARGAPETPPFEGEFVDVVLGGGAVAELPEENIAPPQLLRQNEFDLGATRFDDGREPARFAVVLERMRLADRPLTFRSSRAAPADYEVEDEADVALDESEHDDPSADEPMGLDQAVPADELDVAPDHAAEKGDDPDSPPIEPPQGKLDGAHPGNTDKRGEQSSSTSSSDPDEVASIATESSGQTETRSSASVNPSSEVRDQGSVREASSVGSPRNVSR